MTNRSTRIKNGKKSRVRLVDLEFRGDTNYEKENIENGRRPHGGYKGSKKHPLSPYSYNRDPSYLQQISDSVERSHHEDLVEGHRSPLWAIDTSRESNHSGESPLFVHGLLSSSRFDAESQYPNERPRSSVRGRSAPPKRNDTLYYRPNSTHQYLSATELRQGAKSSDTTNFRYGRPTRTTLLRARQRSNSAPVNAYTQRREIAKKAESTQCAYVQTSRDLEEYSSDEDNDYMYVLYLLADRYLPVRKKEESSHAFLTGARYNRAHLLDAKGLSVYGVYMPRQNPQACFMTGAASSRLKERVEDVPAPPDTPRSEADDYHDHSSKPVYQPRPATAPGKRLLSGKAITPRERPKSAWGDATTSCDIIQNESENLSNEEVAYKQPIIDDLILIPNGLNVQGNRVLVSLRSSKQSLRASESKLPSVTGISVPKVIFKRQRDPVEETSQVNQPPPTPVGGLSRDESECVRKASLSVRDSSTGREDNSIAPVITTHINVELDKSLEMQSQEVQSTGDALEETKAENVDTECKDQNKQEDNNAIPDNTNSVSSKVENEANEIKVFITENNSKIENGMASPERTTLSRDNLNVETDTGLREPDPEDNNCESKDVRFDTSTKEKTEDTSGNEILQIETKDTV